MNTYVFDLDGTLANCDHRQDHALNKDWEAFHSLCHLDGVHHRIVALFRDLEPHHQMVVCTGRSEKWRKQTMDWLFDKGCEPDFLLMRGDHDFRPDHEYKLEAIRGLLGAEAVNEVICWFEDRDQLVEKLRNEGFTVLQVKAGAY